MQKKRSFFERLTGIMNTDDDIEEVDVEYDTEVIEREDPYRHQGAASEWIEEEASEGELTVDVYQTGNDLVIQTMVAGVRPEDLDITINRETVVIKGKREAPRNIADEDYFFRELYWGPFSRTILLPQEIEPEESEAMEKNGLLVLRLPKINKDKTHRLKVRSV